MNWLRKKLINIVVKKLFRGLTEEDILQVDGKGVIIYKGQPLDKRSKGIIASQAGQIDDMLLWKILLDEMDYRSEEKMFPESENISGLMFGKAMLHNNKLLRKRVKYLKNIK